MRGMLARTKGRRSVLMGGRAFCIGAALLSASAAANAQEISVTIENTLPAGQTLFTPVWIAAHDGSFDSYSGGEPASNFPGLTELAEEGNTSVLSADFAVQNPNGVDATVLGDAFFAGGEPPVFNPGETVTFNLDVQDSTVNRFFSYASMIIPSNDLFIANGNPMAHEIFDINGDFNGPITIEIFGSDINDNGTELNVITNGAAFTPFGSNPDNENELIRNFLDPGDAPQLAADNAYLASIVGTDTPVGQIQSVFGRSDLIARITITPEPTSLALIGLGGVVMMKRRRKQNA